MWAVPYCQRILPDFKPKSHLLKDKLQQLRELLELPPSYCFDWGMFHSAHFKDGIFSFSGEQSCFNSGSNESTSLFSLCSLSTNHYCFQAKISPSSLRVLKASSFKTHTYRPAGMHTQSSKSRINAILDVDIGRGV